MASVIIKGNSRSIRGDITPPGDKSISHRAIIISSIAEGKSTIKGFLKSDDTLSTTEAFKSLGLKIEIKNSEVLVYGNGLNGLKSPINTIDCGNSGTTARLLLGLLSAQPFTSHLTGDKYLRTRPMGRVVNPLKKMGAKITGDFDSGNKLPLNISGQKLRGIEYELPVASAQVKSALILAGLYAEGETVVIEPQKTRDHTERMLTYFGADIDVKENKILTRRPKQFFGNELNVPSDISSAAFFIVSAIINPGSEILIKNIGLNPARIGVLEILEKMGAYIRTENKREEGGEPVGDLVVKSSDLKGIEIKGDLIPKAIDELPILTVAACFAEGETLITEAKELRVKETDRIKAMSTELKKLGADITEFEDGMFIRGKENLSGNRCYSWGDHRVAMSLAIAATKARGETIIENSECVKISFPQFFQILKKLSN